MKVTLNFGDEQKRNYNTHRLSSRHKRMTDELKAMSIEELQEIANEKAPNGCATEYANEARKVIYNKLHYGW